MGKSFTGTREVLEMTDKKPPGNRLIMMNKSLNLRFVQSCSRKNSRLNEGKFKLSI